VVVVSDFDSKSFQPVNHCSAAREIRSVFASAIRDCELCRVISTTVVQKCTSSTAEWQQIMSHSGKIE